ncbi:MAG: hypothetical protein WC878_06015 [Candidatus Paceibacterota bacterium]|jgi:hypothetical protein
MSPQTKKLLEKFAKLANWNTVGLSSDMERFREFVISAFKNGEDDISQDEFLNIVGGNGNPNLDVKSKKRLLTSKMFMFGQYEDGIKLLRAYKEK